ncbi:hypothetical protein JNK13_02435 [bacterium]|nr:hypothetical protein [bacterium]
MKKNTLVVWQQETVKSSGFFGLNKEPKTVIHEVLFEGEWTLEELKQQTQFDLHFAEFMQRVKEAEAKGFKPKGGHEIVHAYTDKPLSGAST